jgi:hypothetical protein
MERDFNIERDLQRSDKILEKVKGYVYAQALYAALCNNTWLPLDTMELLKDDGFMCSWRYAGGLVARLRGHGDYMDFYCSSLTNEVYILEGVVIDEIENDLKEAGWVLKRN